MTHRAMSAYSGVGEKTHSEWKQTTNEAVKRRRVSLRCLVLAVDALCGQDRGNLVRPGLI